MANDNSEHPRTADRTCIPEAQRAHLRRYATWQDFHSGVRRRSGSLLERVLFNNRAAILLLCLAATIFLGFEATKVRRVHRIGTVHIQLRRDGRSSSSTKRMRAPPDIVEPGASALPSRARSS